MGRSRSAAVKMAKEKQSAVIPDKLYFKIGEVAKLVGVKPYVLRYWETEFTEISPTKSRKGQRLYKRKDVELLLKIRDLLYLEKFTISGARNRLNESARKVKTAEAGGQIDMSLEPQANHGELLKKLKSGLQSILEDLNS